MNENAASPVFVALLFILRCLVPLLVLFGIAYLLRRLGLVEVETPEPSDDEKWEGDEDENGTPEPPQKPGKQNPKSSQKQKES
jgi:hypothetical protein